MFFCFICVNYLINTIASMAFTLFKLCFCQCKLLAEGMLMDVIVNLNKFAGPYPISSS
jgi:hypothetical protein